MSNSPYISYIHVYNEKCCCYCLQKFKYKLLSSTLILVYLSNVQSGSSFYVFG